MEQDLKEIVDRNMSASDLAEILNSDGGMELVSEGGHMPFVDREGNPLTVQRIH